MAYQRLGPGLCGHGLTSAPTQNRILFSKIQKVRTMNSQLFYIHALSPMHMGTGAAVGGIDLPHSREAATQLPNVPGSGIKGVWRDQFPHNTPETTRLFGSDWSEGTRDQAALLFSDAWLLCMPVMSYVGDFAWVSSPMSLARFARERCHTMPNAKPPTLPLPPSNQALVTSACSLLHADHLYLHELKTKATANSNTQAWAELIASEVFAGDADFKAAFIQRFVIVSEAELLHLSHTAAHVPMRNALDDNKKVENGALWSEENMPAETIFWGTVAADTLQDKNNTIHRGSDSLAQFMALAQKTPRLQLGGKATVGRGICRFVLPNPTQQGAA
jgi:CRISPR-associated protein Cmr4